MKKIVIFLSRIIRSLLSWFGLMNAYRQDIRIGLHYQVIFRHKVQYLLEIIKWLAWYRLWLRKDEFHIAYWHNPLLLRSGKHLKNYYVDDVNRRRHKAHCRSAINLEALNLET